MAIVKLSTKIIAEKLLFLYIMCLSLVSVNFAVLSDIIFLLMAIFCIMVVFSKLKRNNYSSQSGFYLFSTGLIILAYASSSGAIYKQDALNGSFTIVQLMALAFCIYNIADTKRVVDRCFTAMIVGGYIMFFAVVLLYGWSGLIMMIRAGERVGAELTNENMIGGYSALTAIILYARYQHHKKKLYIFLMLPLLLMIVGSASRASMLTFAIGVIWIQFLNTRSKRVLRIIAMITIMIVSYQVFKSLGWFPSLIGRFEQLLNIFGDVKNIDGSTRVRKEMIEFGWRMFKKKPILGYGMRQFIHYYGAYSGYYLSPHTTFTQISVSLGVVGFVFWYGSVINVCRRLFKQKDPTMMLVLALILTWICMGISRQSLTEKIMYVFIALGYSCVNIGIKQRRVKILEKGEVK